MKCFQTVKEIRSKSGHLHFKRYAVLETKYFSFYIHRIYQSDKDAHMHSHPWAFLGITIKGSYIEQYIDQTDSNSMLDPIGISLVTKYRLKKPLSIGFGGRNYFHKIHKLVKGPVTSLFFTFGQHKNWYYKMSLSNDGNVESREYRNLKNSNKL